MFDPAICRRTILAVSPSVELGALRELGALLLAAGVPHRRMIKGGIYPSPIGEVLVRQIKYPSTPYCPETPPAQNLQRSTA
jgi:hypothetical protein